MDKEKAIEIAVKLQKELGERTYEEDWDCADQRTRAMRICITAFLEPFGTDYYQLEEGGYFR